MISSATVLPQLGFQWAEDIERRRLLRRAAYRDDRPSHERALESLICTLPGHPELEDRTVWWRLVTAFEATADWARQGRARHLQAILEWSSDVVTGTGGGTGGDHDDRVRRLVLLVLGGVVGILAGELTHAEVDRLIRRHVDALAGATRAGSDAA
jgi:hypothetical protein